MLQGVYAFAGLEQHGSLLPLRAGMSLDAQEAERRASQVRFLKQQ
jgi:hypothetical protein